MRIKQKLLNPKLKDLSQLCGQGAALLPVQPPSCTGSGSSTGHIHRSFLKKSWHCLGNPRESQPAKPPVWQRVVCMEHWAPTSIAGALKKKKIIGRGWILWDHHNSSWETQFGKRRLENQSFFQSLLPAMAMMRLQFRWFREMGLIKPGNPRQGWRPDQQKITPHAGLLKAAAHGTQQHWQKWIPHNSDTRCWAWIKSGLPWGWANVTKIGLPHTITTTFWRPLGLLQHGVALTHSRQWLLWRQEHFTG